MMTVSVGQLICARHGGGMHMSKRLSSHDVQVTPVQVWPALTSDLRTRIVGFLAQLALNAVTTHSEDAHTIKEVTCAYQIPLSQNSSRSS